MSLRDRLDPGLPGARALAAVAVVAAVIAGGYLWTARPRPQPVPAAAASLVASPARPAASPRPPVTSGPTPAGTVVVHVAGKVRRPGVITLPAGSRVTDAIRAAGGLRPGVDTGSLNLARRLTDGEQIPVGLPAVAASPGGAPGSAPGVPPAEPGTVPGTPLDLNTATVEQLQELPGVGPVLARRIVDHRTQHGGFRGVEQLREVSGIGERRFAELKDLVRV
ncbi:MAG TPA: ComEA family DNA-binding protein [Actinomadura sp.]|nr:ComEA family DNA-binding protein [Actinomadura sp.]